MPADATRVKVAAAQAREQLRELPHRAGSSSRTARNLGVQLLELDRVLERTPQYAMEGKQLSLVDSDFGDRGDDALDRLGLHERRPRQISV